MSPRLLDELRAAIEADAALLSAAAELLRALREGEIAFSGAGSGSRYVGALRGAVERVGALVPEAAAEVAPQPGASAGGRAWYCPGCAMRRWCPLNIRAPRCGGCGAALLPESPHLSGKAHDVGATSADRELLLTCPGCRRAFWVSARVVRPRCATCGAGLVPDEAPAPLSAHLSGKSDLTPDKG